MEGSIGADSVEGSVGAGSVEGSVGADSWEDSDVDSWRVSVGGRPSQARAGVIARRRASRGHPKSRYRVFCCEERCMGLSPIGWRLRR